MTHDQSADRFWKCYGLRTGEPLARFKSALDEMNWRNGEFIENRGDRESKCQRIGIGLEITASVIDADRLHVIELVSEESGHNIRYAGCTADAQNREFADTSERPLSLNCLRVV
jgi:hypothetical protein